jgi:hypothetical protein
MKDDTWRITEKAADMARSFRRDPDDDDDETELLEDGAIGRVRMMLRDSEGTPPGRRPGFVRLDDEAAYMRGRLQKQLAYESYQQTLEDSWRGPIREVADEAVDTAVADAAAHANHTQPRDMRQVYQIYDSEIRDLWKGPR